MDDEQRRFFKQSEIVLWREKTFNPDEIPSTVKVEEEEEEEEEKAQPVEKKEEEEKEEEEDNDEVVDDIQELVL